MPASLFKILNSKKSGQILLLLLLPVINLNPLFCQLPEADEMTDGTFYREEIYVTTDRDLYFTGEKIQLRLDLLNLLSGTPSQASRVVYVELVDPSGNPLVQLKAGLTGSTGSAEIQIPDTLRTGSYIIRSATAWMQNFSDDLFSHRLVSVINPFEIPAVRRLPEANPGPDSVLFFPESGSLVAGLESVVGLKCFSRRGNPVSVRGYIINEKNDTVAEAETGRDGYGLFTLTPETTGNLFLVLNGTMANRKIPLPSVSDKGVAFSILRDNTEELRVRIRFSLSLIDKDRYYLNYSHVSLPPLKRDLLPADINEIVLDKKDLPGGPAFISIVNSSGDILAGRWVINDGTVPAGFSIRMNKTDYSPREKVSLEITAAGPSGYPVSTGFSVSVVKSVLVNDYNHSPSFRGFQNAPLAVMNPNPSGNLKCPDDYLIFAGDFDNEARIRQNGSETGFRLPEMEGHLVSGTIRNTSDGEPLSDENLVMSYVGKSAQCRFTRSNEKGQFNYIIRDYGKKEIVIQPLSGAGTSYYVEIMDPFPEIRRKYNIPPFNIDSSRLEEINRAIISMQVESVYKTFTKPAIIQPEPSPDFYGKPDLTIRLDDYIRLTTFREVIREILPGVSTYRKNDQTGFRLINKYPNMSFETDPLIVVDGVPVAETDKVLMINSEELEKVDVLNTRYFFSDIMIEGIINIKSKKGDLGVMEFTRPPFRQEFDALQKVNEFYFPVYDTQETRDSRIPDFRNTLFWDPDITTDDEGKAGITFYTSDEAADYTVIIKGLSPDGKPAGMITGFRVNPLK